MGRYHEAISSLTRAIELRPEFSDAHYNIGVSYAHLDDQESAATWLRKAIALNPALSAEARKDKVSKKCGQIRRSM
jgi:tetratricopeptide (TPR) repeat protein